MAGAPSARRKQSATRKKVYVPLNKQGAEIHLPAIPIIHAGWRLLSALLVVVFGAGAYLMWNSSNFQISAVKFVGSTRVPTTELDKALDLEGTSILAAVPSDLAQTLISAYPGFSQVSVQVGLPASVVVNVKERQPLIAWVQGNDTQWIDANGMAFPARGTAKVEITIQASGNPPAVKTPGADPSATATPTAVPGTTPVAANAIKTAAGPAGPFISKDMITAIEKISKKAPANTPILYDPQYGLGWYDTQGCKVYFGMDTGSVDVKLQQVQTITDTLSKQGIHPTMINVEFPNAPFYRLEP
jgi:hypothetical protein